MFGQIKYVTERRWRGRTGPTTQVDRCSFAYTIYACLYACSISVCPYVCISVCQYGCMFACLYACISVCMSVWLYVGMSVRLYVYQSVCVHTYLRLAKNFLISYADQVYFKFESTPTAWKIDKSCLLSNS